MMGLKDEYQSKLELIDLNVFVPSNHILRQINEKIDFCHGSGTRKKAAAATWSFSTLAPDSLSTILHKLLARLVQ
ncbi:hypothetical protein KW850_31655 [Bacillus sp. sid0103]|jgi:hypothetical protein|uniref:hypothetical protein n=1 Tax=Bacillus sp. sid0103 TaxID=2856337 RepID=UPI001C4828BB|nr:hypothetical protein [Bacillus sp. sid0103]MBV7509673.1 hypothetical protein [Bacillus sp. sid0103]